MWGRPRLLREGEDGVLTVCGPLVSEALKARDLLEKRGKRPAVVNHPFVNRIDVPFFRDLLAHGKNRLLTVEDHQSVGGMGTLLTAELLKNGLSPQTSILGLRGVGRSAYKASDLYRLQGLDAEAIARAF